MERLHRIFFLYTKYFVEWIIQKYPRYHKIQKSLRLSVNVETRKLKKSRLNFCLILRGSTKREALGTCPVCYLLVPALYIFIQIILCIRTFRDLIRKRPTIHNHVIRFAYGDYYDIIFCGKFTYGTSYSTIIYR